MTAGIVFLLVGVALMVIWYALASKNRALFGHPLWQFLGDALAALISGDIFESLVLVGAVSTLIGLLIILFELL